jgi:hypothetical protein
MTGDDGNEPSAACSKVVRPSGRRFATDNGLPPETAFRPDFSPTSYCWCCRTFSEVGSHPEGTSMFRNLVILGVILMSTSTASAMAEEILPPRIAAPANAQAVIVILDMRAKDPVAFKAHLLKVIPVTRRASGIRFSWTAQDQGDLSRFTLFQEWDSLDQQQGYIAWRTSTGDLAELLSFLQGPPRVEIREVFDR